MNTLRIWVWAILALGAAGLLLRGAAAVPNSLTGNVWTVCAAGCDFTTIQAGVDGAAPGDTLSIAADRFVENVIVTKNLALHGAGAGATIVDGGAAASVLAITGPGTIVTMDHLTITNGGGFIGGGLLVDEASVTLINTTVSTNTIGNDGPGAGIYCHNGALSLANALVAGNNASSLDSSGGDGGGLYVDGCHVTVADSTISGNLAGVGIAGHGLGGGIFCRQSTLSLANFDVVGNVAGNSFGGSSSGGGIFADGCELNLSGGTLGENKAGRGAGIDARASHAIILDSLLADNYTHSPFRPMYACGDGAAIRSDDASQLEIIGSAFEGNRTCGSGGGIASSGVVTLTQSVLTSNRATGSVYLPGRGGGVFVDGGAVTIRDSTFHGNGSQGGGYSLVLGGGIGVNGGAMTLINSTLSDNEADQGGGIHAAAGAITVTNSTLSGNTAALAGGALYLDSATATLVNSILTNSLSGGDCAGGGTVAGHHNLIDDASCGLPANPVSHLDLVLADNGGPTLTHALLAESNAIDSGDNALCPARDQRGLPRPVDGLLDGTSVCDIGACEYLPPRLYLPSVAAP